MPMVTTPFTRDVIGCAIKVHRVLGPGLLEMAYGHCMCHELRKRKLEFQQQVALPLFYEGHKLPCVYRADLIVERQLLVEFKVIERVTALHRAQTLTYMRLAEVPQALLINFNVPRLVDGLHSFVAPAARPSAEVM
ncbi:MAG: GxxExxY protein [Vicinamibacterales bacterium]